MNRWVDPPPHTTGALAPLGVSPLVEAILLRRGLTSPDEARNFLQPKWSPATPFPGTDRIVERLFGAVRKSEKICVWGDFDVDGQTATALLVEALQLLGANVTYHVPIRSREGHGVHLPSLQQVLDDGVRLVLTCDTGITAHNAVSYALGRGVDFLITDHHDPIGALPDAYAIANPKLLPAGHELADLAGAGVAYKLAESLLGSHGLEPVRLMDLAALGLIADLALLRSGTRALARRGIEQIRRAERLGLRLIAQSADIDIETLNEESIAFGIAPRLNALGRLGDANAAVELLLSQDEIRGRVLTAQIEGLNSQRKLLTAQVYQAAEDQIASDSSLMRQPILLLAHASWPAGVLGIVASRLVERYRKPVVLLSLGKDQIWHGSARSIEGFHITRALAEHHDLLISFGGHPMAAGLSVGSDQVSTFQSAIQETSARMLAQVLPEGDVVHIDQWIALKDLTPELAHGLEQLAPYGPGNAPPVLASRSLHIKSARRMGPNKEHLKLAVVDEAGTDAEVLWWNAGDTDVGDTKCDVAYSVRSVAFRGGQGVTLTLIDLREQQERPVDVVGQILQFVDMRQSRTPGLPSNCLVWEEGARAGMGVDRFHLHPAQDLAILTSPPGRRELIEALAVVKPSIVYLVGKPPDGMDTPEQLLTTLAGMAKFAMKRRQGHSTIPDLAAALAQRELSVRIGLEWLAAGGHLCVEAQGDDVHLTQGSGQADRPLQEELLAGLRSLLEETLSYRAYFIRADPRLLLPGHGPLKS